MVAVVVLAKGMHILVTSCLGSLSGSLSSLSAHAVSSVVIKDAMSIVNLNGDEIDEVILGQVLTAGISAYT